ncbi:SH3 domain-binding glutamic acid-rich-like protein isoform X1 [Lingula anatina]|uniref:SH3 domain-binding glutamic acid-rich-like protein isoform X1 n=1 Tax=Lingula anatina TaxID=7574 RepID=A0A1S3IYI4_LINAN|nr:SH3 domain-binding glutamic acid-rich-like protein isoform X1 [Lingula anatina]|eukprot:XP_013403262.1 SH3 domain-binding glutamic acid-rich-like protein isoform X1 [Lingula anatina]
MVIKLYMSSLSGSTEIKKKQSKIKDLLESLKIEFEEIDISDHRNEKQKEFMRNNSKGKKEGETPIAPQLFNDDKYLGDYDAFLDATENEQIYEFFQLQSPKKDKKSEEVITNKNGDVEEEEKTDKEKEQDSTSVEDEIKSED